MFLFASPTLLYNSGSQLKYASCFLCMCVCVFLSVCDTFLCTEREGDYVRMPTQGSGVIHHYTASPDPNYGGTGEGREGHWLRFSEAVCCVQVCDRVFTELNPATCLNKHIVCVACQVASL